MAANPNWISLYATLPKIGQKCYVTDPRGGFLKVVYKDQDVWWDEENLTFLRFKPKFWKERADLGWA